MRSYLVLANLSAVDSYVIGAGWVDRSIAQYNVTTYITYVSDTSYNRDGYVRH